MKKWIYKDTSESRAVKFAEENKIGRIFAYLLLNRGIDSYEKIRQFVYTGIDSLCDPFEIPGMVAAVNRIKRAAERKEKVTVYGDYDVDGITASTLICNALSEIGINADIYIPDRLKEGYGLNRDATEKIYESGTTLIITVDTGITAVSEVEYGNEKGIDFVITDHHEPLEIIPDAQAVVNPKLDDASPCKNLAGVGVAFKLACALLSQKYELKEIVSRYIDLVCLGTVSDIVPLYGENRFYVKYGLKYFKKTKNPGLAALIGYAGYSEREIDETAIGFGISPRINAAGRMGKASYALKLLNTKSEAEADELAKHLCDINNERKTVENKIFESAVSIIEASEDYSDDKVLVVAEKGWHTGVLGIVASRLLERFGKPVILMSIDESGIAHGSARSVPALNIFTVLENCANLTERFGGHSMAAGLTIKEENIIPLRKAVNEVADVMVSDDELIPTLEIDYEAEPSEITLELAKKLSFFEPFGEGNPCPVFSMRNLTVDKADITRDGKHLRLKCECMGIYFFCIAFNMGNMSIKPGDCIDIAFNLKINDYNGDYNFIIKDIIINN